MGGANASDDNPGTASAPFATIQKANHGFDLTGRSRITVKGLNFFACDIPTNGNSLWPTGHGIANPHRGNAIPAPSNGIVIDGCRFKYLSHFQTLRVPSENEWEEMRDLRILHHNPISRSHLNETGIRLTGDDCIVRNSVFFHSAGAGIVATGRNWLIENNFLKDISYQGTKVGGILTTPYSNGARILRNTVWRMGRSGIDGPGPYNTFGTPEGGTPEQPVRMMGPNNCQLNRTQYTDAPQSINNNIYMNRQSVGPTPLRASELAVGREGLDPSTVFVDPTGRSGGLGFQLKAGSPAINRGVSVNGTIDATGKPIDYVDDFDGPAPDCGAYEFGKEPWVPGCNLSNEFIEGQPWERQWGSKRKF